MTINSGPSFVPIHFVFRLSIILLVVCFVTTPLYAQDPTNEEEMESVYLNDTFTGLFAQEVQTAHREIEWSITFGKVFWATVIFLVAMVSIKYLTNTLERMSEPRTNLRLTIKRLIPIIRILGWALILYVIVVDIFAPPLETLFAISASAGIAIGFASQDVLKNIFGGITILIDRPFQVGDKIEISTYYGEVTQIGLRSVRIVTPDDSQVSIPNGEILNQLVSNTNTGESNALVVSEFFLPPDIDLVRAKKIAYRAAAVSRYIYLNKPISVILNNEVHHGRSLLRMRLKAYVLDIRYEFPFSSEMTEIVLQELLRTELVTPEQLNLLNKPV